jgi:hypothetical protein
MPTYLPALRTDLLLIADRLARAAVMPELHLPPKPPPDAMLQGQAADAGGMVAGEIPAQIPLNGDSRNTPASAEPLRVKASELRPVSRRLLELVLEVDALDRENEDLHAQQRAQTGG